jgi:hypothetical protein
MDPRLDFSYLDTPLRPADGSSVADKVVLRLPLPNSRLPAYLDGTLAWGTPPTSSRSKV